MNTFILVLFMVNILGRQGAMNAVSIEFDNEQACKQAFLHIVAINDNSKLNGYTETFYVDGYCVSKQ